MQYHPTREKEVFDIASELSSPAERGAIIYRECADKRSGASRPETGECDGGRIRRGTGHGLGCAKESKSGHFGSLVFWIN
jgi:hypothetical protein